MSPKQTEFWRSNTYVHGFGRLVVHQVARSSSRSMAAAGGAAGAQRSVILTHKSRFKQFKECACLLRGCPGGGGSGGYMEEEAFAAAAVSGVVPTPNRAESTGLRRSESISMWL